jgi:signal transduction histidine kinase
LAASLAVVVTATLSSLLVSLAIATYDSDESIWARRYELTAGMLISMFAGLIAILWVIVLWHEPLAGVLLAATSIPVFVALRVFERLARRHDELGIVHALTKELDSHDTVSRVSEAGLARAVAALNPGAAVVLIPDEEPVVFFEADDEALDVRDNWEETVRYHRDVCADGGECACGRRILGQRWDTARSYRVIISDEVRGMMIVRPRVGRGTEISSADHGMLEVIAAQLSSAMTRIVAVNQLRSEIEEKQALVRSKDQLIASVSHELRTPLTGIIGFAELLAEGESLGPVELEHAKRYIANEAHDLGNIVEDLLTAARSDLGSLEVQAKPVSTTTVIERAMLHLHADSIEVTGPDCWLSGDAPRVRQILRNLMTNAVKYGGKRIEVSAEPSGSTVIIRVVDNGAGVSAERVQSIFEPYESAHEEPSQPGSLGLGLSISRTLARLMDGELSYHRIAEHTEFRLTLPALQGVIQPEEVAR